MKPNILPGPSPRLKTLIDQELGKQKYAEMDPEIASLQSLEAVYQEHGDTIFDFTNPTDEILRQVITADGLA